MANPYLGEIRIFPYNFAPAGWAMCNGQILSIAQYTALFSLLGTTYGGNGVQTFALPDLRGRVPVHQGQGPGLSSYVIGEQTGAENTTLLASNMPQHNHALNATTAAGSNVATPASNAVLAIPVASPRGTSVAPYSTANNQNIVSMAPTSIGLAGGNVPFSNVQPLLCLTFCIALTGIFPSRN